MPRATATAAMITTSGAIEIAVSATRAIEIAIPMMAAVEIAIPMAVVKAPAAVSTVIVQVQLNATVADAQPNLS
jgi:hypothetical protein